jgi:recombination protein RecT
MANEVEVIKEKNISDNVLNRVKELQKENNLQCPANYSYQNALKSAWLILQETVDRDKKPVLNTCTQMSIMNSLLNMVIQGLSPAKKQCYFIAMGGQLQLMRSYMGTVAVTKRLKAVSDVKAYCIYEGDEFETEFNLDNATLNITKFNPKFENIDNTKIKGAFAVVIGPDGPIYTEIMSMKQIQMAWSKSRTGGQVHKDFAEEMAKKTVINRACKMFANTSDDSDILIEAFNDSDKDYELGETLETNVQAEIKVKANTKEIDIQGTEEVIQDAEIITDENSEVNTTNGPDF